MSMKRMVSYVCYAVAALALLAVAFLQLPQQADVGLALLFAMAFGAGNTNRVLAKWAQDSEYQKHVMDERNLAIKEKAGNITNMFTTTLLGIAIVVFLCMGYVFPDKLLAYAGMSPSTYQSGQLKNCYPHMEKRGSRYLRYALYNATKYVCHWDPTFAAYLAKKRAEGKHYNVALSHATKKLVRLIFAMEKSRQPYRLVA